MAHPLINEEESLLRRLGVLERDVDEHASLPEAAGQSG
jgi:hypothetical protein